MHGKAVWKPGGSQSSDYSHKTQSFIKTEASKSAWIKPWGRWIWKFHIYFTSDFIDVIEILILKLNFNIKFNDRKRLTELITNLFIEEFAFQTLLAESS